MTAAHRAAMATTKAKTPEEPEAPEEPTIPDDPEEAYAAFQRGEIRWNEYLAVANQ